MTNYIQHRFGNLPHIVRETWSSGEIGTMCGTMCGKWYWPSTTFTPDLGGEREEDVVCYECRRQAAEKAGKRVYSRPTLRRGLSEVSEAKRYKLRKEWQAHQERQKLAAWNRTAQEAQRETSR